MQCIAVTTTKICKWIVVAYDCRSIEEVGMCLAACAQMYAYLIRWNWRPCVCVCVHRARWFCDNRDACSMLSIYCCDWIWWLGCSTLLTTHSAVHARQRVEGFVDDNKIKRIACMEHMMPRLICFNDKEKMIKWHIHMVRGSRWCMEMAKIC